MTMTDAIILGVLQGAAEFLPISSSAHLVIGQAVLKVNEPSIFLEVALHLGTLLSVLIYYWKDVIQLLTSFFAYLADRDRVLHRDNFRMCLFIIIGSIPAAVGGLLLKDWFEATFESATFSGAMLLVTATFLIATHFVKTAQRRLSYLNTFLIGVAQLCAILPGISRSGSTISAGLFQGIEPHQAARFSFLLSLPAVAGAVILKSLDLLKESAPLQDISAFAVGAVVSFAVGLLAIHWLLKLLAGRKFYLFGFYCLLAGLLTILFL